MKYDLRIPFPSEHFAECAMKSIGVDPPFTDTKTRKTTIKREMSLHVLEDGKTYLNIVLSCDNTPGEINCLRTSASSLCTNLTLIC